jgi:LysR family transcriptional regulator, transcriptional activator for aaeXAB operon
MKPLFWELSVLSRAVAYPNLSAAAGHVGLSQPQLSRIVTKLEAELGAMLLDRTSRRNSTWTPMARQLADVYSGAYRRVVGEVQVLLKRADPFHLKIGTLEGMSLYASMLARFLLKNTGTQVVQLDVEDLNRLDELFLSGELDLIFTFHLPGKKKPRYQRDFGFQTLDEVGPEDAIPIRSTWEFGRMLSEQEKGTVPKTLVSNSLQIRRYWLFEKSGRGINPSEIMRAAPSGKHITAMVLGSESLSPAFWQKVQGFDFFTKPAKGPKRG